MPSFHWTRLAIITSPPDKHLSNMALLQLWANLPTWDYHQLPQPPPSCSQPESSPGSPPWLQGDTAGNSDQWQRGLESSYPRGDHPHPKTDPGLQSASAYSLSTAPASMLKRVSWATAVTEQQLGRGMHSRTLTCQWPRNQPHPALTPLGPSTVSRGNPRQTTAVTYSITDT